MMIRFATTLMLVAIITLFGNNTKAQEMLENSATIRGEVIDITPEKNPIPGVKVTVVSVATNEEYTTHTDEDGEYEIKNLPAGRYTLSYSKNGYGKRVGKSNVVAPGGEIFDRIKMRRQDNILTFLFRNSLIFVIPLLTILTPMMFNTEK